jgi:hypothetical protein
MTSVSNLHSAAALIKAERHPSKHLQGTDKPEAVLEMYKHNWEHLMARFEILWLPILATHLGHQKVTAFGPDLVSEKGL